MKWYEIRYKCRRCGDRSIAKFAYGGDLEDALKATLQGETREGLAVHPCENNVLSLMDLESIE